MDVGDNLYSAAQSRELDRIAIEEYGHPGLELMKTAGRRAFDSITRDFSDRTPLLVLCGSGNNGGDGYVVARCAKAAGLEVTVCQAAPPRSDESVTVCQEYLDCGGSLSEFSAGLVESAGLIVDGLLGTGLDRGPSGNYGKMIEQVNQSGVPVVSLDVPSGLDSDTGYAYKPCIQAQQTVTFIGRKLGMSTGNGTAVCGEVRFESLDLEASVYESVAPVARFIQTPVFPGRGTDSHKGMFGNVMIAGGHDGMLGATLLAGKAALRCGSGLVTIASTREHMDMPALHSPELMSQCLENHMAFEQLCNRCDVVAIGPGLGQGEWSQKMFDASLALPKPMVVDADGLTLLAQTRQVRDDWVLTPHPGEAARLLGISSSDVQRNRLDCARRIADRYGGTCVLKGAGTIVAGPGGEAFVNPSGNAGMATAGMGDVLSGIIAAFIGLGFRPEQAALTGVWLHSASADRIAVELGMASLLAGDVVDGIPEILESFK